MKLLLIITVFICCVLIGFLIKNYYKKRQNFFINLCSFCDNLTTEISYNNQKLNLIITNNSQLFNDEIGYLFNTFNNYLISKINADDFKKDINKKFTYLTEKEKNEITYFFINLGNLTKDEELKKISNFTNWALNLKDETINKNNRFSSLYFKLFLFLGLIFIIIFI